MISPVLGAAAAALILTGCTAFTADGGFAPVERTAHERLHKDVRWARTPDEKAKSDREIAALLSRPLDVDDAVQIALLSNGGLQASFEQLGISEADLVQSGRLPNPRVSLRRTSANGLYDIEETLSVNVLALVSLPYVHAAGKRHFAEAQSAAAAAVVELAERTREAYFTALAAHESAQYLGRAQEAADAGAELARRMRAAGNWNGIEEARERAFYLDAASASARARAAESVARESLAQLFGTAQAAAGFRLAERLPDLPRDVGILNEQEAIDARIDLRMMRARIAALAADLHLTKVTRFVNVLQAGPARVRQGPESEPFETGFDVSLEVPIFDGGGARVRRAEALYAQAVDRLGQAAIDARAEVRKAYAQVVSAHEIAARERDEMLPLRRAMSEEDLRRYNASQIGIFELLAGAREEMLGVSGYIDSVRDFWLAQSQLDAAMLGRPLQP